MIPGIYAAGIIVAAAQIQQSVRDDGYREVGLSIDPKYSEYKIVRIALDFITEYFLPVYFEVFFIKS